MLMYFIDHLKVPVSKEFVLWSWWCGHLISWELTFWYARIWLQCEGTGGGAWVSNLVDAWTQLAIGLVLGEQHRKECVPFNWGTFERPVSTPSRRWPAPLHAPLCCARDKGIGRTSPCEWLGWCLPPPNPRLRRLSPISRQLLWHSGCLPLNAGFSEGILLYALCLYNRYQHHMFVEDHCKFTWHFMNA